MILPPDFKWEAMAQTLPRRQSPRLRERDRGAARPQLRGRDFPSSLWDRGAGTPTTPGGDAVNPGGCAELRRGTSSAGWLKAEGGFPPVMDTCGAGASRASLPALGVTQTTWQELPQIRGAKSSDALTPPQRGWVFGVQPRGFEGGSEGG